MNARRWLLTSLLWSLVGSATAAEPSYSVKLMTPETALKAARAALESCRQQGFQVAVAVVDRSGLTQVMLRDRYAGAHTPDTATNKAWTAASFRTNTSVLAEDTQAGKTNSGIRHLPRFTAIGGGIMVQGGGTLLGAIGVSGAPGGAADEVCALAGLKVIQDDLDF